jgi:hypothetical protein
VGYDFFEKMGCWSNGRMKAKALKTKEIMEAGGVLSGNVGASY